MLHKRIGSAVSMAGDEEHTSDEKKAAAARLKRRSMYASINPFWMAPIGDGVNDTVYNSTTSDALHMFLIGLIRAMNIQICKNIPGGTKTIAVERAINLLFGRQRRDGELPRMCFQGSF